jgi:tRNA(Ile)-lysidine synthase
MAEIAADEEAYWAAEVARVAPQVTAGDADELLINIKPVRALPLALVRRILRQALGEIRGNTRGLDAAHVEAVVELLESGGGEGRTHLPGVEVIRSFDQLRLAPSASGNHPIAVQVIESYNEGGSIDADSVPTGAELRAWRPGDRLELSPGHAVKLKELFQRARIPVWERREWPVLARGSEVIWTRRFGVGAPYAADRQTRRFLEVVEGAPGSVNRNPTGQRPI